MRLLTAQEVAEQLQVPESWVYGQARAGRFPHVKAGRYVRFDQRDVEAWVEGQRAQHVAQRHVPQRHVPSVNGRST